jgi:pyruvate, orthophosphate dikinase
MTFGFSRDDAGKFLECYQRMGITKSDPFESIDQVRGIGDISQLFLLLYVLTHKKK